jgi:hypothetical protein
MPSYATDLQGRDAGERVEIPITVTDDQRVSEGTGTDQTVGAGPILRPVRRADR